MQYAQLNKDGTYSHQITTSGNVEWGPNHFCPASTLTPDEATLFRIVPLFETDHPAISAVTQAVMRDGGEFVASRWQYKWSVTELFTTQAAKANAITDDIETKRVAAIPAEISPRQIRQALTATALRSSVEAAVAAADQDTKDWWEFATTFERAHPRVIGMAQALGVTPRQMDDLWVLGGSK